MTPTDLIVVGAGMAGLVTAVHVPRGEATEHAGAGSGHQQDGQCRGRGATHPGGPPTVRAIGAVRVIVVLRRCHAATLAQHSEASATPPEGEHMFVRVW